MTKYPTQTECKARFEEKLDALISDLQTINSDTPWSHSVPEWWLRMMDLQKQAIHIRDEVFQGNKYENL